MTDAATPERAPARGIDDAASRILAIIDTEEAETAQPGRSRQRDDSRRARGDDRRDVQSDGDDDGDTDDEVGDGDDDLADGRARKKLPPHPSESDGDPQDEPEAAPEKFRVKVNGEEIEVTRDELLKGYSRLQDYKAKTAELAADRRKVDTERTAAAEIRQRMAKELDSFLQRTEIHDPILAEARHTDWQKLAQENPLAYLQKSQALGERIRMLDAAQTERNRLRFEEARDALKDEHAKLETALPEWKDAVKRTEIVSDVKRYLTDTGFTDTELHGLTDHRVFLVALDAMKWRANHAAQQAVSAKKASKPLRVERPGAAKDENGNQSRLAALKRNARRSGRLDDQAAYILAALKED